MLKILLIEDDATMMSLLTKLLEMEGFQILFPSKLTQGEILDTISETQPDLVFTDVLMKQVNGLEIVSKIPANRAYRILMTSGLDVETECLKAGADGFILKPYFPEELIRRIRELIAEN
ncbi:MAG TPA: response regulator [Longilinea sp.]|nr:response regulator [Longilinea sp.]